MKKMISILMVTVLLASLLLPFGAFADQTKPTAKLQNLSGAVYPGCTLELGIAVTGDNVQLMQFDNPIIYDAEQLTVKKAPYTTIADWSVSAGPAAYMLESSMVTLEGKDADNLSMVRFSFTLNDSVKIGDTIKVEVRNVRIAAAENNTIEKLEYSVTVAEKPKSTNCNLLSLRVEEGTLTPAFDAESANSTYALTVNHTVDSLTIKAGTANAMARFEISGNGEFKTGENTVTITVTAESGAKRVYTLVVTKQAPPSTEAGLSTLEAAEGSLSPVFDTSITVYRMNVATDVTKLTLNIAVADPKATFTVEGNEDFKIGENIVTITVTAEDPSVKAVYVLTVVRARPVETNAQLIELMVNEQSLTPEFDAASEVREYTLSLPYEIDKMPSLTVKCASIYAKHKVSVPEKLEVGENEVTITVTAEDGVTVETYKITVTRRPRILSSDATLKELKPDSGTLSPAFDPQVTVYTMMTEMYHPQVSFIAAANDSAATTEGVTKKLVPGMNTVTISCKAEDGTVKDYTVYVFVPVKEEKKGLLLNGAPLPGEKLTALLFGDSDGGSYTWYVGDKEIEGVTSDSYTPKQEDVYKTIKAVYTDVDGTVLTSQTMTILSKMEAPEPSSPDTSEPSSPDVTIPIDTDSEKKVGTTELVIMIVLVVISIVMGIAIGSFVVKRKYRNDSYNDEP